MTRYGSRPFPDWNAVFEGASTATTRTIKGEPGAGNDTNLSLSEISLVTDYLPGLVDAQMALWEANVQLRSETDCRPRGDHARGGLDDLSG